MVTLFAVIATCFMLAAPLLLIFGLPGTWVILGVAGIWAAAAPESPFTLAYFITWGGLAFVGEGVEFAASYYGTKLYGGSSSGSIGGMIGALVGAILCAPLFLGVGALLGAFGGAFAGCLIVEKLKGKETALAVRAAWGTTLGRFGGFVVKMAIAVIILWQTIPLLWQ